MLANDFRVIPVLDILRGQAVHARAGHRSHYQPIQSLLHPTSNPLELANAYRDQLGLDSLYVADLDAILDRQHHWDLYRELAKTGLDLWIDAGIRELTDAMKLIEQVQANLVVGLETIRGPAALGRIVDHVGADRVVFSLDQREGSLLSDESAGWGSLQPYEFCRELVAMGIRRWILLDLARVGTGRGTGTDNLLTSILGMESPGDALEVLVGGGIAGIEDVRSARTAGAAGVLVASALHDGRITRSSLQSINADL